VNEVGTPRVNGDTIRFSNSGGALPTGLYADVLYFVVNKAANTFQLAYVAGGGVINFTSDGTGTNTYRVSALIGIEDSASSSAATPGKLQPMGSINISQDQMITVMVRQISGGLQNVTIADYCCRKFKV
jgi:hypothetical protein